MVNSFRSPTTWTCASQAPRGTSKATVVFGFGPAAETRFKLAIETHKALAVLNSARRVSMGLQSLRFLHGVPPHSGNGRHRPRQLRHLPEDAGLLAKVLLRPDRGQIAPLSIESLDGFEWTNTTIAHDHGLSPSSHIPKTGPKQVPLWTVVQDCLSRQPL